MFRNLHEEVHRETPAKQQPFSTDRCAVNQTFSTAEFHWRPCSKHLDAAFCSNMSKTKVLNQSFIQKDLNKHTCRSWLQALFRCLRKCCNLFIPLSSQNACSPNTGWVHDDYLFFFFFKLLSIIVFFSLSSAFNVASFIAVLKPSRVRWHVAQRSIFQIILRF